MKGHKKGTPKAQSFTLRILSYNIHQALTVHKRHIGINILKEAIKALGAEVVLLQEVAGTTEKRPRVFEEGGVSTFQLEDLADEIWPHYAYQKNAVFTGGFHGNAILSKYPIVRSEQVDLTIKPFDSRGLLYAELSFPEQQIHMHAMATHLGLLQFERQRQLSRIIEFIEKKIPNPATCFLGGDFNDWRQVITSNLAKRVAMHEAFQSQQKEHARTFPSRLPLLQLDRIYFRGLKLVKARCLKGKPWHLLSDHLPLLADFEVKTEKTDSLR